MSEEDYIDSALLGLEIQVVHGTLDICRWPWVRESYDPLVPHIS